VPGTNPRVYLAKRDRAIPDQDAEEPSAGRWLGDGISARGTQRPDTIHGAELMATIAPPSPPSRADQTILGGISVGSSVVRRALKYSLYDGMLCAAMVAMLDTFTVAGAVYLKVPLLAIGILAGLPLLLSSLGQIFLPYRESHRRWRKKYVLFGASFQSLLLLVLAFVGFLPPSVRPWAYVAVFTLQGFFGNLMTGVWMAWMGNLVMPEIRGRFFAWRTRIISIAQLASSLFVGVLAFRQTNRTTTWLFFMAIFIAGSFLRLGSTVCISRQHDPDAESPPSTEPPRTPRGPRGHFLHYAVANALMLGAVALAGPFFSVWYVRGLQMSYFALAAVVSATVLGVIIALPLWGHLSDHVGHRGVIVTTALLIALVPIPFCLTSTVWVLVLVNVMTGLFWSGYNLSTFNYLLALTKTGNPERYNSLAIALSGVSIFLFSLLGGFLSTRLPTIFAWQLQSLFFLSSLARLAVFSLLFLTLPKDEARGRPIDFLQFSRRLLNNT
jgi:MFS family permease